MMNLIECIFLSDNLRDIRNKLETIEEDYQSSVELEQQITSTRSIRLSQKGLFLTCFLCAEGDVGKHFALKW